MFNREVAYKFRGLGAGNKQAIAIPVWVTYLTKTKKKPKNQNQLKLAHSWVTDSLFPACWVLVYLTVVQKVVTEAPVYSKLYNFAKAIA